jgi:hypothetical protein
MSLTGGIQTFGSRFSWENGSGGYFKVESSAIKNKPVDLIIALIYWTFAVGPAV